MATTYKVLGQVAGAIPASTTTYNTISNKAVLVTNVATLTTSAVHGYAVGDVVTVAGVDTTYDGTYVVASVPTTTTFTYAKTSATLASTAVSPVGIVTRTGSVSGANITNKYKKNNVATLTANAHGLSVGDIVYISIGDSTIDGRFVVNNVPTTGIFTVNALGADIASAACGGAFAKLNSSSGIALTTLYTVPAATNTVISTLSIANRGTTAATYRVAIRPANASIADTHYIAYDSTVAANDGILLTIGITLAATDVVSVSSSATHVTFNLFGSEIS